MFEQSRFKPKFYTFHAKQKSTRGWTFPNTRRDMEFLFHKQQENKI